ncbi:MAG: RNA 2',3'-cyclic phosphodiesterase [Clostridiales bacterium]|jgi:2'-5' RNA ligase|nr:RNA 2',3'-cyclic phosphodiesterase [Clostridiales bacterium]
MRLFIAVNFEEAFKLRLSRHMEQLRKNAIRGNFSRVSNLHITLAFIGETDRVADCESALQAIDFSRFSISFDRVSRFKRRGGDICWLGVREDGELKALARSAHRELSSRGFRLEEREFKAHLTLGREVVFKSGFEPESLVLPEDLACNVDRISLMKSERVKGLLTYTELSSKFCI